MQKDFWKELFRPENKKVKGNLLLALIIGILLLVVSGGLFPKEEKTMAENKEETNSTTHRNDEIEMERRMAEILAQIEGAGQVDVMLTFRSGGESVVAQEEKTEETHTEENGKTSESLRKETAVVMTEDGRGNTSALVLLEEAPLVEGVVIVAEGGGDAVVCNALNSAAQALLNVPAHKIAVLKMK